MKRKLSILIIVFLLILACANSVLATDDLATVKAAGVLRFGTASDYIPFVFMDDTTLDGMDVALVSEIGKRLGVRVEAVDMAFNGLIDSVNIGQVDLIGGALSITDARRQQVDFSNPYYSAMGIVVALSDSTLSSQNSDAQMQGIRLGVQSGTSFDQWAKSNLLMGGHITTQNLYTFPRESDMMRALKNREVDIVLIDEDVFIKKYKADSAYKVIDDQVAKETYGFAAVLGSTLIPAVNTVLNEMIEDGTAQSIATKYFSMTFEHPTEASISRPSQIGQDQTAAPAVASAAAVSQPANCRNGMQFVNDVSVVDGTILPANSQFEKIWNIKNTGSCIWDTTYSFNYVKGDLFGVSSVSIQRAVNPGETYQLSLPVTAPNYNGDFVSYWQMRSGAGKNFGQTIWCNFLVNGQAASTAPGQERGAPVITKWQPSLYTAPGDTCPIVYWEVLNAIQVEFYIDNQFVQRTTDLKGSTYICSPEKAGTYTYGIRAVGNSTISYAFQYTNTGSPKSDLGRNVERNIPPSDRFWDR